MANPACAWNDLGTSYPPMRLQSWSKRGRRDTNDPVFEQVVGFEAVVLDQLIYTLLWSTLCV